MAGRTDGGRGRSQQTSPPLSLVRWNVKLNLKFNYLLSYCTPPRVVERATKPETLNPNPQTLIPKRGRARGRGVWLLKHILLDIFFTLTSAVLLLPY